MKRSKGPTIDRGLLRLLTQGVRARAFPMASAWVAHGGRVIGQASVGGASVRTRFDVASLTKPMVVVTQAMRGVSEGWLDLERPIADDLPPFVTPYTLLAHRAGLPAWKDLVAALPPPREPGSAHARYAIDALVRQAAREADPTRGAEAQVVYSDLGYILLGRWLEERHSRSLATMTPAGSYRPLSARRARSIPSCGWCAWRGREVQGEVHDPNAWVMGGVAGHAGVFASAAEVGQWALGLERADAEGRAFSGIDPEVVRWFWDPRHRVGDATWVVGWDTPSPGASSAGRKVSANAVGHLGFTGTSVWIDRAERLVVVLLTNRVALGASAQARLKGFRPAFHDGVRALIAPRAARRGE